MVNDDIEDKKKEEAIAKVHQAIYRVLKELSQDPYNRHEIGQNIASLYSFIERDMRFSNVRPEDLDRWSREELNLWREMLNLRMLKPDEGESGLE